MRAISLTVWKNTICVLNETFILFYFIVLLLSLLPVVYSFLFFWHYRFVFDCWYIYAIASIFTGCKTHSLLNDLQTRTIFFLHSFANIQYKQLGNLGTAHSTASNWFGWRADRSLVFNDMYCLSVVAVTVVLASAIAVAVAVAVTGSNSKTCLDNFNFENVKRRKKTDTENWNALSLSRFVVSFAAVKRILTHSIYSGWFMCWCRYNAFYCLLSVFTLVYNCIYICIHTAVEHNLDMVYCIVVSISMVYITHFVCSIARIWSAYMAVQCACVCVCVRICLSESKRECMCWSNVSKHRFDAIGYSIIAGILVIKCDLTGSIVYVMPYSFPCCTHKAA